MERALITLDVAESKRIIARAVIQLPEVQEALRKGKVIVAGGTTNAYIYEEITGKEIQKERYTAGITCGGRMCVSPAEGRISPAVFIEGEEIEKDWLEVLEEFTSGDVFFKGGNAFDLEGNVGVMIGNPVGGTIGKALPIVNARGAELIFPIGLEKLIPSVPEAASLMGIDVLQKGMGMKVGMNSVNYGEIFTEVDALESLFFIEAFPAGAGGIGGSEGSQTILLIGDREELENALEFAKGVKGEPPLPGNKRPCPCEDQCIL